MTHWKQILLHLATDAEGHFDTLYERLRQRMGWSRPAQIVPYLGYGTSQEVYLKGRVIEDKGITSAMDNDTIWLNLLNMYKRYNSQEIGGARVQSHYNGRPYEAVTDRDGFFEFRLPPPAAPTDHLW